jgi:hypothetical protein
LSVLLLLPLPPLLPPLFDGLRTRPLSSVRLLPTLKFPNYQPASYFPRPRAATGTYSLVLEPFGPAKRKRAALARSSLGNVHVVEVSEVLYQMVPACEALVGNAVAAWNGAGEFRCAHAMDGRLVALEIS